MLPPPTVLLVSRALHEGEALARALAATGKVTCVGVVTQRAEVVPACQRRQPQVVLLELVHPDGHELVGEILAGSPRPVVVLSPSSEQAAAAIAQGAVEALPAGLAPEQAAESLTLMAAVKVIRRLGRGSSAAPPAARVAALAASTGGPGALKAVLQQLPARFASALLVVQHMPAGFAPTFVEWLAQGLSLPVRVAASGDELRSGVVLVAPDQHHLLVGPGGVLSTEPGVGSAACPSADRLLLSLARAQGLRTFGAVLTGMGQDGAEGLRALRMAGGTTLVQDARSSVVDSMPRRALERGAATEALAPEAIGRRLALWGLEP